ncbi:hypothetical protein TeGR_g3823 [Tetraparma gracilis]|nr:hypothetical protein TeGR_g3823 [Tetraparma gracilis]
MGFHRHKVIATVCGGNMQDTFPKGVLGKGKYLDGKRYVTVNLDWNPGAPNGWIYAKNWLGENGFLSHLDREFRFTVDEDGKEVEPVQRTFHLFSARHSKPPLWDYAGVYRMIKDEFESHGSASRTARGEKSKDGVANALIAKKFYRPDWAKTYYGPGVTCKCKKPSPSDQKVCLSCGDFTDYDSADYSDRNLVRTAKRIVEKDEFWTQIGIENVGYDDTLYGLLCEAQEALNPTTPKKGRTRAAIATTVTPNPTPLRVLQNPRKRQRFSVGDTVKAKWENKEYKAEIIQAAETEFGYWQVSFEDRSIGSVTATNMRKI